MSNKELQLEVLKTGFRVANLGKVIAFGFLSFSSYMLNVLLGRAQCLFLGRLVGRR